jgi:hypothetical protein
MAGLEMPKSVRAYRDECAAIVSFFPEEGWLDQDEFDKKSAMWKRSQRKRTISGFDGDTIVLPFFGDPLLAILHELQAEGVVDTRKNEAGRIEYRLRTEGA